MNTAIISCILLCGAVFINARPQQYNTYDSSSASSGRSRGGGGGGIGDLNVECNRKEVSPGKFAFSCDQTNRNQQEALTLKSEHVLWIQQGGGQGQLIDVLVPNYKIDELIKAGFKGTADGGTRVNILLKKPDQTYNAEVGQPQVSDSPPSVNVQYEPVQNVLVHYPNDKPYRPLSGPILPPA